MAGAGEEGTALGRVELDGTMVVREGHGRQ
jgi:hypothetical protein